jgi:hypothetical protein
MGVLQWVGNCGYHYAIEWEVKLDGLGAVVPSRSEIA